MPLQHNTRVLLAFIYSARGPTLYRVAEQAYIRNESVPIQLAQCWFPGPAISNAKIQIYFQIKYTEAILSNSTRTPSRFEIIKMLIEV